MPFKLSLLFIILLASFTSCQKEITAGDPDPLLNDTATLLKMINTRYNNGVPLDSSMGVIKNAYINGQKRILITWTNIPAGPDTSFTEFTYNTSNQLTRITRRSTDPADEIITDEIIWQNDRVSKVKFLFDGVLDYEREFFYSPNGSNTNISNKRNPSIPDTIYSGGIVESFNTTKTHLTVNSQFIPVSYTQTTHRYRLQGMSLGLPGNSYDTTTSLYTYEGNGNLAIETSYSSLIDTNITTSLPDLTDMKDTTTTRFTRSLTENPAIYGIISEVFGEQLIVLSEFYNIGFGWEDVLGDYGSNPFMGGFFSHYKQTLNLKKITSVSWHNGIPLGGWVDEILYKADNTFDSQNRLTSSLLYYDYPDINFKRRIIYP